MEGNTFGRFFHAKRRATSYSLRKFCVLHGFDPGNLSKLERGLLPAPQSREKLEAYAKALGLQEGTDDWFEFFDLAAVSANKIPSDIASDPEIVNALLLLFRSIRNKDVEAEQLHDLVKAIQKELRRMPQTNSQNGLRSVQPQ